MTIAAVTTRPLFGQEHPGDFGAVLALLSLVYSADAYYHLGRPSSIATTSVTGGCQSRVIMGNQPEQGNMMNTQPKPKPVAAVSPLMKFGHMLARGIERWKHGMIILLMLFLVAAVSLLFVGVPLKLLAEVLARPGLASHHNIALLAAFIAAPFFLTHPAFREAVATILNAHHRRQ